MATKRTPEQIMKELAAQARDDEAVDELASKSKAELEKELAAAGVDVDEEKAAAQAFRQKLERSAAERRARLAAKGEAATSRKAEGTAESEPQKPAAANGTNGTHAEERARRPRPLRRRPVAAWIAAGVAAAAAGGVLVANMGGPTGVGNAPDPVAIRREALAACQARSWQACLEKLDQARELDPAGDGAREVQEARRAAEDALHPKTPPAPRR